MLVANNDVEDHTKTRKCRLETHKVFRASATKVWLADCVNGLEESRQAWRSRGILVFRQVKRVAIEKGMRTIEA